LALNLSTAELTRRSNIASSVEVAGRYTDSASSISARSMKARVSCVSALSRASRSSSTRPVSIRLSGVDRVTLGMSSASAGTALRMKATPRSVSTTRDRKRSASRERRISSSRITTGHSFGWRSRWI
jgi:hypothetical protein